MTVTAGTAPVMRWARRTAWRRAHRRRGPTSPAPIPDGNQITDYAIIVQDEAAQVYGGFLTGQAVVGSTLTAVVAAAGLPAQTVGYTWLRSTDGGSNWAPINGAGGSTTS